MSYSGVVKFFNDKAGFGFIWPDSAMSQPADQRENIFFHASALIDIEDDEKYNVGSDDIVSFEIVDGKRGPQATDVKLVKSAREKRKISIPASKIALPVKRESIPLLSDLVKHILSEKNIGQFSPQERDALEDLRGALKQNNADKRKEKESSIGA